MGAYTAPPPHPRACRSLQPALHAAAPRHARWVQKRLAPPACSGVATHRWPPANPAPVPNDRAGKKIRCPIHRYTKLGPAAVAALDTRPMQRLRHLRQLGCSSAVYPSAEHSRFTHSLGVAHLGVKTVAHLKALQPDLGARRARVRARSPLAVSGRDLQAQR